MNASRDERLSVAAMRAEVRAAALNAAAAVLSGKPPPMRNSLEREAAREALREYTRQRLSAMWARVRV